MRENTDSIDITEDVDNIGGSKIASFISILLHPLFITFYGILLLFVYTDFQYIFARHFAWFMIPVFIFSCLIPALSIFLLKKAGYISNYGLDRKEERLLPFLITFMSYLVLYFYFYKAGLYNWFLSVLLVPLILLLIVGTVNLYWKISAHMTSIGALLGTVFSVSYNIKGLNPYGLFIILIILAGALGVSRLVLRKHTPAQVYIGFLIGLVVSYLTIFIVSYYPILIILMRSYFR